MAERPAVALDINWHRWHVTYFYVHDHPERVSACCLSFPEFYARDVSSSLGARRDASADKRIGDQRFDDLTGYKLGVSYPAILEAEVRTRFSSDSYANNVGKPPVWTNSTRAPLGMVPSRVSATSTARLFAV
jgi:hypothetical protein